MKLPDTPNQKPPKKSRWKRWGFWAFMVFNLVGLILAYPLLKSAGPLVSIWWNTRSQASFHQHQQQLAQSQSASPETTAAKSGLNSSTPEAAVNASFSQLSNHLTVVQNISEKELSRIVASQFGGKKRALGDPTKFDQDSAVFDSISSTNLVINGKSYYCYEIDLVDQNGNHKINIDGFTEPNLEYERSKATMELVNRTPQLRKIYNAMAYVLAEKSTSGTNASALTPSDMPAIRLEKEPVSK